MQTHGMEGTELGQEPLKSEGKPKLPVMQDLEGGMETEHRVPSACVLGHEERSASQHSSLPATLLFFLL